MYGKIDRYILIAILIIGALCLYFLFTNHKGNTGRDSLLIAMAEKLNARVPSEKEEMEEKLKEKFDQVSKPSEEEEYRITAIADKLCFSKQLDPEEVEFQKRFPKEIKEELEVSQKTLGILIYKFLNGVKEFDDKEQEFYEVNKEEIDVIVQNRMLFDSIIKKITTGTNDFTAQELEFQQVYGQHIEAELARIKQGSQVASNSQDLKGANPPTTADQRLKTILSFFEDGIPKTVTELANKYAEATKTKPHTSNRSADIGKLVDDGKLMCTKPSGKHRKIYHGPPTWFDGKNLKPEYEKNIPKS